MTWVQTFYVVHMLSVHNNKLTQSQTRRLSTNSPQLNYNNVTNNKQILFLSLIRVLSFTCACQGILFLGFNGAI
jgi:hypothetical protein